MSDKKKVILTVGNVRIKDYDSKNVTVERYEDVYNPITKEITSKWQFKGYSRNVLSALLLIQRNELLIDKNTVSDLESYLNQVEKSNDALLEVVKQ